MKRSYILLTILIMFSGANCWKQEPGREYVTVAFFVGEVKKNGRIISIGEQVAKNDRITTGSRSSCDIKIGPSMVRIKEKSKLSFAELLTKDNLEKTTLELNVGKILCKPKKLLKGEKFVVQTPTAVAGVRGTQFTVEADTRQTTRIKVFDGKVRVAKRVQALDSKVAQVLDVGSAIKERESVIITKQQAVQAGENVKALMASGKKIDDFQTVAGVIGKHVAVDPGQIASFRIEDFVDENSEIINVKEKPAEVITQIKKIIRLEKKDKGYQGRLLITRYEIYYIKDGKVAWEGKVIEPAVTMRGKVFIASQDYIFAALEKGPVLWRKEIPNDGKLEVAKKFLFLFKEGKKLRMNPETGSIYK